MKTEYRFCKREEIPALRTLWKEAFGDTDAFLDSFYNLAFATDRCCVAVQEGAVVSAAYWFPCTCREMQIAYVYAVATREASRGQGLGQGLLNWMKETLEQQGLGALLLVPASRELVRFYAKLGYLPCSPQGRIKASAAGPVVPLKPVSPRRYGQLRQSMLPAGSVIQEGVSLDFQATMSRLYSGKDLLLAATIRDDGTVFAHELLCRDPVKLIPGILKTLKAQEGIFCVPFAQGRPVAMYLPLRTWQGPEPGFFAFSFG